MPLPRAALVILGLAVTPVACGGDADPCEAAYRGEQWAAAATTCRAAFERSGDARDGIRAALASDYLDDIATSTAIARRLTAGPEAARAHRLLAESDRAAGHHAAAAIRGATALALHAAAGVDREIARDAYALAEVLGSDGGYEAALPLTALARDAAVRARDRRMQGHSEIGRGDLLRLLGDRSGAERAYEVAAGLLAPYCDRGEVRFKQARLYAAQGQLTLARQALDDSLAGDASCRRPARVQAVAINQAWLSWRRGDLDAAASEAAALPRDLDDAIVLRALVMAARGDTAGAAAALTSAPGTDPDSAWPWLLPHLLAQVEELRGDDAAAESAYRRAIAAVARVRAASPSHAAYVAASHRMPYEGLIALLARHQRWRDALGLVLALDASGMLRGPADPGVLGAGGVAEPVRGDERPVATAGQVAETGVDTDAVVAAWADRDLVVVVVPSRRFVPGVADRAWRLHVRGGAVTGSDAGPADEIELASERLLGDPHDRAAAAAVGAAMVPAAGAGPLHVLPVGRVAQVPLAALRVGDGWVGDSRPLVRVLGLRPRPTAARPRAGAVVLGDPGRDLAAAAEEARAVGAALGVEPAIGDEATVARLIAARDADVLHVAAHTDERAGRRVLHLADGDVAPRVIVDQRIAPRLVVLASCGSAAARDEGGWGSLAAAFAVAGSDHVLATQWSVDDAVAADLVHRFYAAGGVADPARALATAQMAMARTATSTAWAAFTLVAAAPSSAPRSPGTAPGR